MTALRRLFTIGHSTRTIEEFVAMLQEADVQRIVDVRFFPGSRRHPQFGGEALARALASHQIDYQHLRALGGRRKAIKEEGRSRNTLWRVDAFRHYADYAESGEFQTALERLESLADERPTAIMCAEAVWWRCHRRLITDYVLSRGWDVVHLMAPGQRQPGVLTPGAVVHDDGTIEYPASAGQASLPM
jgi:uncharacterized protein (DUF488 family)